MRLKSTSNLCRLAGSDELTVVKAPDGTPMECRVLKVTLKTGETEYLITNVLDYWIAPNCFRDLYFERWKIESKYLELKEQWKIEEFTGTGTLAVLQDFYISMLHANLASIAKNGADEVIQTTSGSEKPLQIQGKEELSYRKNPKAVRQMAACFPNAEGYR